MFARQITKASRNWTRQVNKNNINHISQKFLNTNQVTFQKSNNPPFEKILIANRGEISIRVQRTCRKMGIKTVVVHSEADANGLFVQLADEAICIGPPPTNQSYLQIERIVNAVKMTGAQAVHPGFGFLSENKHFAAALEREGVVFIGPPSHAIEVMGDKISSKKTAKAAGVNTIPGDNRIIKNDDEAVEIANQIGYPVMVKAAGGGGGKGMRIAWNDRETRDAFRLATNEALSAFGNDRLFVEKYIEEPRHVEIQVLADKHGNVVFCHERECSIQRRNQKVYEEAPSPVMIPELRKKMGGQATALAKAVGYVSAGTCEFLVDKHRQFYFLEMNTRLQVEHPITEKITGLDLVEQMINIASGKPLPFTQEQIPINGWALEARVYAEDPFKGFLPQTGTLTRYREPLRNDPDVRCDSGVQEGAEISIHYDPMICKLITHGPTRDAALAKMRDALDSYVIHGLNHNIPFLRSILDHPKFIAGEINTKFILEHYPEGFGTQYIHLAPDDYDHLLATAATTYFKIRRDLDGCGASLVVSMDDPTQQHEHNISVTCKWNGTDKSQCNYCDEPRSKEHSGDRSLCDSYEVSINDKKITVENKYRLGDYVFQSTVNGSRKICQVISRQSHEIVMQYKGLKHKFNLRTPQEQILNKYMPQPEVIDLQRVLLAPMPGNIFSINIKVGQKVLEGQEVCVIEAMKMQNIFYAQKDGIVKAVYVKQGDSVQADQKIYELE